MAGGSNPPSATTPDPLDSLAAAVARGATGLRIARAAHLVLAVSGGPDSMGLLHGCARLVETGSRAWRLTVAHLDHGLRPDSDADALLVGETAAGLGLPFRSQRTDVAALAADEGRSIEDAGREARYRFFESVAGRDALIVTAHTADDAAETVLINLLRGSGSAGVRGIPARRGRVVRPLLGERRVTIRAALDGAGRAYRLDPSNADPSHLRNRIRNDVLPLLESIRPGSVAALVRHARLVGDDDELLDAMAAAELARRRGDDGAIDWRDPPARALGRRVLRLAIGPRGISAERIESVLDAAEGARGGLRVELGGGRDAWVQGRRIRIG